MNKGKMQKKGEKFGKSLKKRQTSVKQCEKGENM